MCGTFTNFCQKPPLPISDSANDMNTNAYKAAIHKVHERTIYEPSNALPFYVRDCGGGWACFESRHKDWRFYYLSVNTRFTEPEVVMEWSLNPMVSVPTSEIEVLCAYHGNHISFITQPLSLLSNRYHWFNKRT